MSIVLQLQKLAPMAPQTEMNMVLNSLTSLVCPTTGVAEHDRFEME